LAGRFIAQALNKLGREAHLTLDQVTIPIANLAPAMEGYRVVQLSDLHLYPFTQLIAIERAVKAANALKPDLIVITGDFVTSDAEAIEDLAPLLGSLNARDGIYCTLGNHDHWSNAGVVRRGLRKAGLTVLHNQSVPLAGGKMWLSGLDDGWVGRADFAEALDQAEGDAPVLLMMHEPDLVDEYSTNARIALQLSGHTHGGQLRLMRARRAYTLPYLGKKYDAGLYRVNQTWLYTNRGIGTVLAPIRFNCPPEVTELTLVADSADELYNAESMAAQALADRSNPDTYTPGLAGAHRALE
jgi:predicted MPP superfamily phosphohydrolase